MRASILSGLLVLAFDLCLALAQAQPTGFSPGRLAVLRAGDGDFDLRLRQTPIFVDQYETASPGSGPSFTVALPTNGPNTFFINGHAATEGNLALSADRKLLTVAGYGGVNLLQLSGTAGRLDIRRGCASIDRSGAIQTCLYKSEDWEVKMNPRGCVADGTNGFWGCGNANGTFFFSPSSMSDPVRFTALPNSRAIKVINNSLFATMSAPDAYALDKSGGIYGFKPALPRKTDAGIELLVPAKAAYQKTAGFDLNREETIAYMCDTAAGIQKYVKTGGKWVFAYNFSIPQNIPSALNAGTGCFGVVVDFSKPTPVLYATTTEGYGGSVNSNRVVRIVDTNATATVTTLVQAPSTNIVFRGIAFTPE
jgi:hypothetical protein